MLTRRNLLALLGASQLKAAEKLRITRYDLRTARVPMAERVRDAWIASFRRQKREQTHYDVHVVRLWAGADLVGFGEAKMKPEAAESILRGMVGHSPWEYLLDDRLGGILIAVYDLLGRATGLPVSRLFAPRVKDRVVQTWWSQCFPPSMMGAEAALAARLGYRVHKIKARPWEDPVAQAEAICSSVPKDYKVWVDANGYWESVENTLAVCGRLERFPNYFGIETPVARGAALDAFRRLKGRTRFQTAEHIEGLQPMEAVREKLLTAFIVAAQRVGQTMVSHAALAEAAGMKLWVEHGEQSGIGQVFQAHQAAAMPSVEYCISVTNCLEDDLIREPFTMRDGFYQVPTDAGLGVSLDEDALEKYRLR
ncbi:MAG: enolase C-terminal domain-like protein [Bryobacteraceae bacterium]|nr:enolase C-terminal domain-like protein [Bryobacteraceae bacterium]